MAAPARFLAASESALALTGFPPGIIFNGALFISNGNWKDDPDQADEIIASGLPPQNDFEAAIVTILPPGAYTAIVAGKDGGTGVALAELYHLE